MTKVIIDNSISLDGYVSGPNDSPSNALGEGGMALHQWYFAGGEEIGFNTRSGGSGMTFTPKGINVEIARSTLENVGSIIFGRHTYDVAQAWGGNFTMDCDVVIVTHDPPIPPEGKTTFYFVDNVEDAVEKARGLAESKGPNAFVSIGGANVAQQALNAQLVDEIHMHIAPVLLGGGVKQFGNLKKQFTLEPLETIEGPGVTHIKYAVKY